MSDTVSKELKRCPFCGGDEHISILWDNEWGSTAHAHCTGCSACGPLSHATSTNTTATSGAIAAWNRRTPDWRELAQELAVTLNHFRGERCWYSNDDALIEKARKAGLEV